MINIPTAAIMAIPVPMNRLASSSLLAPRHMLKLDAVPTPVSCAKAMVSITVGKATLVAALPSIPTTLPMKI